MVRDGTVTTIDGIDIEVTAESLCVHGDTPGSVHIAAAARAALEESGITVRSFM